VTIKRKKKNPNQLQNCTVSLNIKFKLLANSKNPDLCASAEPELELSALDSK